MTATSAFTDLCPGCFADKGNASICSHCGYDEILKRGPLVLAHRTLLNHGQYLIGRVLGKPGGFGITYLALDTKLETRVAIKEYLPRDLAGRDASHATVAAHSAEDGEFFRYGLTQFLQEARTLAQFDHANIVRVRNFFEENGTGYLVMDYYDGVTLADYLAQQPQGRLPEKTAVGILMPILDGLREVHAKNFLHRDIKPQNIYLTTGNRPILLDFGAARQAMSERSRSLSVVLSEGYAPYEQYHRRGEQGPWTDIYACAAVLYHAVAGEAPPPATERVHKDELDITGLGLSASLANALRLGLAVDHHNRPQRMTEFQDLLLESNVPISMDVLAVDLKHTHLSHSEEIAVQELVPVSIHQAQQESESVLMKRAFGIWILVALAVGAVITMMVVGVGDQEKAAPIPEIAKPAAVSPAPTIAVAPKAGVESDKVPTADSAVPIVTETKANQVEITSQVMGKIYGKHDQTMKCWRTFKTVCDGSQCEPQMFCMKPYRTDKISALAGDTYYVTAMGDAIEKDGSRTLGRFTTGLVGAFVVKVRNGRPEILASNSEMEIGSFGSPAKDWSFVKLGSDYWGWLLKVGSGGPNGPYTRGHRIFAPYGQQVRELTDPTILVGYDLDDEDWAKEKISLVATLAIDSSQGNEKVYPLRLTVTGNFKGQIITPKTWTLHFDQQRWIYATPKGWSHADTENWIDKKVLRWP